MTNAVTIVKEVLVAKKCLRLTRIPTGPELNKFYGNRSLTSRITRFGGIKKLSRVLRMEYGNDMSERGSYEKPTKTIEIGSDFSNTVYKLGAGLISFGDNTFELDQLDLLIKELQGIYDVYVEGVHYMKYRKMENT